MNAKEATLGLLTGLQQEMNVLEAHLHQVMRDAREHGASLRDIGQACGISHEKVRKILEEK
jgi:DNA-directed RNA polymerase sigma subunit (sigma70/sigma32)